MNMRRMLALALAALMTMALACGATAESFTPALDIGTECEVRVGGNYGNFEALEAAFDRFNEYYPEVTMSYTMLDDYNNMIVTAVTGADAPDIFCAFYWMVDKEMYAPLFEQAEDLSDPALGIDLSCVQEGLVYHSDMGVRMVPVLATTQGMLVNEALFEAQGIAIPKTFEELVAACEAFHAAGYENAIMGYNSESMASYWLSYPVLCQQVAGRPEAIGALNALDPSAGELLRPMLERVREIVDMGLIDLKACAEALDDSYTGVILRFFEGDVPMMLCYGDTVSGSRKRESMSEAFTANPFPYSFHPVPVSDEGVVFVKSTSMQFAVNRNSAVLDMANEFMRFLVSAEELDHLAQVKRLMTTSTDQLNDAVYAPFAEVDEAHTFTEQELGILDEANKQIRLAAWGVANGEMTIDEAVAGYGSLTK